MEKLNGKPIRFVRYGGLSPVKQNGYSRIPKEGWNAHHAPPAKWGFYAFTWPLIEMFLLGGRNKKDKHSKFTKEGKPISRKVFDYEGLIWHHFDIPKDKIISTHGGWNKSTFEDFCDALRKYCHICRAEFYTEFGNKQMYQVRSFSNSIFKDLTEVFIEKGDGKLH